MEKITFLSSNMCNLRCQHCFVDAGKKKSNEMTFEQQMITISKLQRFGIKKISFSGGEPLLNKNIFSLMEYAKTQGLEVGFLTNALLLNSHRIDKLKEIGIDSLSISFYTKQILGFDDSQYSNYIHNILEKLLLVSEAEISFKLTIPISADDMNNVNVLLRKLITNSILPKTVRLYLITPIGRGANNKNICTEESDTNDLLQQLDMDIQESDLKISIEYSYLAITSENYQETYKCPIVYYKNHHFNRYADPHMDVNGDIYLCGLMLRNNKYCIGNILNDSEDVIHRNIEQLITQVENLNKNDICPVLNRTQKEGYHQLCPIAYERVYFD